MGRDGEFKKEKRFSWKMIDLNAEPNLVAAILVADSWFLLLRFQKEEDHREGKCFLDGVVGGGGGGEGREVGKKVIQFLGFFSKSIQWFNFFINSVLWVFMHL